MPTSAPSAPPALAWTPAGAVAGLVGSVVALGAFAVRPMFLDQDTPGVLREIAGHGTWEVLHLALAAAVALVAVGLVAVSDAVGARDGRSGSASVGRTLTVIGAPVALAAMLLDAVAKPPAARHWVDAEPEERAAAFQVAAAVDDVWYAFFAGWVLLLLGAAPLLIGLAWLRHGQPRWLGGIGAVGGSAGVIIGVVLALTGGHDVAYVALGATTAVVLLWLAASAAWLLRQRHR